MSQAENTPINVTGHARLPLFIHCANLEELIAKIRERDMAGTDEVAAEIARLNEAQARSSFESHGFATTCVAPCVHIAVDSTKLKPDALFAHAFFHTMGMAQGLERMEGKDEAIYKAQAALLAQQSDIAAALYSCFQGQILPAISAGAAHA